EHGSYEQYHGGNGEPLWRQALDDLGKSLASRPDDPQTHFDIGAVHRWLAEHLRTTGGDPTDELARALTSYRSATAIDPDHVNAWSAQVDLHAVRGQYVRGLAKDP